MSRRDFVKVEGAKKSVSSDVNNKFHLIFFNETILFLNHEKFRDWSINFDYSHQRGAPSTFARRSKAFWFFQKRSGSTVTLELTFLRKFGHRSRPANDDSSPTWKSRAL